MLSSRGFETGVAIDLRGKSDQTTILGNHILTKRPPVRRIGVRIAANVGQIKLVDSRIEGLTKSIEDHR